jgi:hypothetical protein
MSQAAAFVHSQLYRRGKVGNICTPAVTSRSGHQRPTSMLVFNSFQVLERFDISMREFFEACFCAAERRIGRDLDTCGLGPLVL